MKFSERWLREWVDPPLDTGALADQLTMAGLEVEAVEPVAPPFAGVVVGRVVTVEPHPRAERLRVCRVDVGADEPLVIVCGAPEVAAGMRVPTALIGANLPGGVTVSKAELRGVESDGMLCSAQELGLSEDAQGLMSLPEDAVPGTDLRACLGLDDVAITLGLTPNRGDCLGLAGIAREVAALNRITLDAPPCEPVPPACDAVFPVAVEAPAACPRYLGRVIRGIDRGARTPIWMQERLRRSGLRSLGPVIDVTNYVLLELGQPMHAFDLDRLDGGIVVRHAREGEPLTLLDGRRLTLAPDTLVIADRKRVLALAGIMGGEDSGVGGDTDSLFLECAFFTPAAIAGRARRYGLHTESSHRFERGVEPGLPQRAMERATRLLLEIVGGEAGPVEEVCHAGHLPAAAPIRLRAQRLARLLGHELRPQAVTEILSSLGMQVRELPGEGWEVIAPPFRFDIAIEADLIEEVARVHGYERLPDSRPRARLEIGAEDAAGIRVRRARELLVDRGYQEVITYSFVDESGLRRFDPDGEPVGLANPLSADMAVMRTTLWPGLVQACLHNLNRQQRRVRLFEWGTRFRRHGEHIDEETGIAGIATGGAFPEQWGLPAREVDFYDVKADVEALLALLAGPHACVFTARTHPALHPGQSACIMDGEEGQPLGWLGVIHPEIAEALGLEQRVVLFELSLDRLRPPGVATFSEPSRFPAIRRDLAVIVDEQVPAAALCDCVREAAGHLLQALHLFDVYRGKGVDSGRKSIGLGLTLQEFSRTLRDDEVDALLQRVLAQLSSRFGATLRE